MSLTFIGDSVLKEPGAPAVQICILRRLQYNHDNERLVTFVPVRNPRIAYQWEYSVISDFSLKGMCITRVVSHLALHSSFSQGAVCIRSLLA